MGVNRNYSTIHNTRETETQFNKIIIDIKIVSSFAGTFLIITACLLLESKKSEKSV